MPNGARQDPRIEPQRAVLDVPEVELDPLAPGQRGAAVDLRPPGDPGLDASRPRWRGVYCSTWTGSVGRGPTIDISPRSTFHEVGQLVERIAAHEAPEARDPVVALLDRQPGADELRPARPSSGACRSQTGCRPGRRASGCRSGARRTRGGSRRRAGPRRGGEHRGDQRDAEVEGAPDGIAGVTRRDAAGAEAGRSSRALGRLPAGRRARARASPTDPATSDAVVRT